jgi:hypothetical protein
MDSITISKSHYDTIVESVEEVLKVLNKVNYDCDDTDPKNVCHTAPFAVGYSQGVVSQILSNLKTIKENN